MGGKAFSSGPDPLFTPRLSPALYARLVDRISNLLLKVYTHVSTPPSAPAKSSHGDIDILVCCPSSTPAPTTTTLASLLGAERTISTPPSRSLAVPHPELAKAYVQVDIRVCDDVESWKWELFHHAYGDLWNLLGTTIRPWGLTANDRGMHLRIEEIEVMDRKKSLIWLTKHPMVVCDLLGVDPGSLGLDSDGLFWFSGLERQRDGNLTSMEKLYEFVLTSRFFRRDAYIRSTLKSNDRKRMAQRDGYGHFVNEWLPTHEGPDGGDQTLTREGVTAELLERFHMRTEYDARIKQWRSEQAALKAKKAGRDERKRQAMEDEEYANAWISGAVRQ
ncbi:MAG: hypothetical protein Q9191_005242 [Dirinaria sp. TL-2023a]